MEIIIDAMIFSFGGWVGIMKSASKMVKPFNQRSKINLRS